MPVIIIGIRKLREEEAHLVMNFSEREGHKKPKHNPLESMDAGLKNAIWTEVYSIIDNDFISWDPAGYSHAYRGNNAQLLWSNVFQQNISDLPSPQCFLKKIDSLYAKLKWNEIYDLIEFLVKQNKPHTAKFNKILAEHNSSYTIINSLVQPVTSNEVINAIESASNNALLSEEIKKHLQQAENLYSNKQNPDFNNSCLESIQAVEGTCRFLLDNNKILSDNIKELKKSKSHNQHIIAALEKLNVFRGNDVAHAKDKDSYIPNREDAILIHTICCGFINYFESKKQDK